MRRWEREPLTPAEFDLVYAVLRSREERAIVLSLIDTGMRANEVLRLNPDWCHWRKGRHGVLQIPMRDDYSPVPGTVGRGPKTKKIRNIPMTLRLHDALKDWFKDHHGFFRTYNHVYNICVRSGEAAGLYTIKKDPNGGKIYTVCKGVNHSKGWHFTPHINRHTFATSVYMNTDLKTEEIKILTGHAPGSRVLETTYLHLDDKDIAEKMEGWVER